MIELKIEGAEELGKTIQKIGARMRVEMAREAIVTAATPMLNAAKRHAEKSRDTGALVQSIGFRVKPYKKNGGMFCVVGPRRGFRGPDGRDPVKYAHLVEFGHMTEKSGLVAVQPFMRPAWQETKGRMIDDIAKVFRTQVAAEARRRTRGKKARAI